MLACWSQLGPRSSCWTLAIAQSTGVRRGLCRPVATVQRETIATAPSDQLQHLLTMEQTELWSQTTTEPSSTFPSWCESPQLFLKAGHVPCKPVSVGDGPQSQHGPGDAAVTLAQGRSSVTLTRGQDGPAARLPDASPPSNATGLYGCDRALLGSPSVQGSRETADCSRPSRGQAVQQGASASTPSPTWPHRRPSPMPGLARALAECPAGPALSSPCCTER